MSRVEGPQPASGEITQLLAKIRDGDAGALNTLFPLVYHELRTAAQRQLAPDAAAHTLNVTALLHETYLKLLGAARPEWHDRRHFFAVAAKAMRQIVIDYARARAAQKRGGFLTLTATGADDIPTYEHPEQLIALDDALGQLAALDARAAQIVELRFFAGLSIEEIGSALDVSPRTVKREWRKARAFLSEALKPESH